MYISAGIYGQPMVNCVKSKYQLGSVHTILIWFDILMQNCRQSNIQQSRTVSWTK